MYVFDGFMLYVLFSSYIFDSVLLSFWNIDIEDLSVLFNSKSDDNIPKMKTQTIYESDSQLGIGVNVREKDRTLVWGLDHFMKIFLCCRRAMVMHSFPFAHVLD